MFRLDGIFLTHFHSDHISEIYEANLGLGPRASRATPSWVGEASKASRCRTLLMLTIASIESLIMVRSSSQNWGSCRLWSSPRYCV